MKNYLLTILAAAIIIPVAAQQPDESATAPKPTPSPWTLKGTASINASQMSLSNWAAGGDPTIAGDAALTYSADYKKGVSLWQNRLELAYGLNRTESNGMRKTNDKIFLSSSYGYKVAESLYVSALAKFNTQFADGFDYATNPRTLTSGFMAPAYISTGLGIIWTPKAWFSVNASPATWRGTIVDVASLRPIYGLEADQKMKNEFGGNVVLEAKGTILKELTAYSRLNLFSNYLKEPQNVDVDWTLQLSLKINKWLSASLSMHAIYDDDIMIPQADGTSKPCLQLQEVAGIGLLVNF
ncbi:MAG: DUF3078 domain-containing protein [Tidjanibacter sp.]|nr:DUF3078 domain-containing protein [Tidjanibacter sp.]